MFIAIKTEDGKNKGKIAFYCKVLGVTRQGFYHYLKTKDLPWKYQALADTMIDICAEDECNDTYGSILHSDRGTQYISELYRKAIKKYGIQQSMNSAGGRCHDNARCESMWARFKEELLYDRYDTSKMQVEEEKTLIWRYFISYWNNQFRF